MKVYLAIMGERCEGSTVLGAFSSREAAEARCLQEEPHFGPWQSDGASSWVSGIDYICVDEFSLDEAIK